MLIISNKQLRKLDEIPHRVFLEKVKLFIIENLKEEIKNIENLADLIKEYFIEAEKKGLKNEREVVLYIIEKLIKKSLL